MLIPRHFFENKKTHRNNSKGAAHDFQTMPCLFAFWKSIIFKNDSFWTRFMTLLISPIALFLVIAVQNSSKSAPIDWRHPISVLTTLFGFSKQSISHCCILWAKSATLTASPAPHYGRFPYPSVSKRSEIHDVFFLLLIIFLQSSSEKNKRRRSNRDRLRCCLFDYRPFKYSDTFRYRIPFDSSCDSPR